MKRSEAERLMTTPRIVLTALISWMFASMKRAKTASIMMPIPAPKYPP
jgi:hypothetical protein